MFIHNIMHVFNSGATSVININVATPILYICWSNADVEKMEYHASNTKWNFI